MQKRARVAWAILEADSCMAQLAHHDKRFSNANQGAICYSCPQTVSSCGQDLQGLHGMGCLCCVFTPDLHVPVPENWRVSGIIINIVVIIVTIIIISSNLRRRHLHHHR